MGEMTNIRIDGFSARALRQLASELTRNPCRGPLLPPGPAPEAPPVTYVPYVFEPLGRPTLTYVDDRNQFRHVAVDEAAGVPAGWKLLYVEGESE